MTFRFDYMLVTLALFALGCVSTTRCPDDWEAPLGPDGRVTGPCAPVDGSVPDDAGSDAGRDAEPPEDTGPLDGGPDAGPCGMECASPTPVCDESSGDCVQCAASDSSECVGATDLCDASSNTCVSCLENADCDADPALPICDGGSCRGCSADTDCMEMAASPVCDEPSGRCVACTVDSETAECGGMSCDPALFTCTATPVGLTPVCGACVADSECGTDHYCVPMTFNSAPAGAFCMKALSAGCARPFGSILEDRESLSGEPEADYCGIDEVTVSCGAVRGLLESQECTGGTDGECGADGALCRTVGAFPNRCTYGCSTPDECPMTGPAATCGSGHCGS